MITKIKNQVISNNFKDNIIFLSNFNAICIKYKHLVSEILLFLISITFLTILLKEKITIILKDVKIPIILFFLLYSIILTSLFFSNYFSDPLSFIFYFRYIIFSLGIFYLISKNEKYLEFLLLILFSIALIFLTLYMNFLKSIIY